jgi:hypothetical protein
MNRPKSLSRAYFGTVQQELLEKIGETQGEDGLVRYPSKSKKISKELLTHKSKLLNQVKPLNNNDKPVNGLTGILWN